MGKSNHTKVNSTWVRWLVPSGNPAVKEWRKFLRLLLCLNLLGLVVLWAGSSHADEATRSELIFRAMTGDEVPSKPIPALALLTTVNSIITGHIVRTTVIQEFKNPTKNWVEGVYYFPLPDDAAVDAMRLKIGDRVIQSEIQEKQQAQKTYNKAASEGKVAALLDQYRPNTFSTRVANVEPGSTVTVEISFQALAKQNGAIFSYVMPQVITPRYNPGTDPAKEIPEDVNGKFQVQNAFSIHVKKGDALDQLSSATHPLQKRKLENGDILVELEGGRMPADRDLVLTWRFDQDAAAKALLFEETDGDASYILGIVLPPNTTDALSDRRRDITFILDISGSMEGAGVEQGRKALQHALDLLKSEDRFQIITFNDQYQKFFSGSVAASQQNLAFAAEKIAKLQADRGTEMYPALEAALTQAWDRNFDRQVVFLTDGAVTNEEEMFALVNDHLGDARLFTVGLGYAPNSWFMRKSAEFGRGLHVQVDDIQLAAAKLTDLFNDMSQPTLRNVQLELGEGADTYPRLVPDLFGQRPVIFLTRKPAGNDRLSIKAQTADDKFFELDLQADVADQQMGIAKLWARHKVEGLMDAKVRGMDAEIVREGVLEVALRHQIMSPYTSFVAVDKTSARVQEDFLKKAQLSAAQSKMMASGTHVPTLATATPMKQYALMGALALILSIFMHIFLRRGGVRK